ncbi:hypothetical protein NQ317_005277 [Molorchus minor]|uniref:Aminopeptidase n=1 Tax=Molorchus minor TaxID=1323400 RepID=A0ABQ9JXA2_9CUCU|nr:hypothetical protein NQ317_005277 [Molorchus minor]
MIFRYIPLLLLSLSPASFAANEDYRLPKDILPSHYSLDLVIDPESDTFSGIVQIVFTASNVTNNTVSLHASPNHLSLSDHALLDDDDDCVISVFVTDTEIIIYTCPDDTLTDGEHTLTIEFQGNVSKTDTNGIYSSSYVEDGNDEVFVATRLEPVYARRVFPCFDEPELKATFDVFITHPDTYSALSNMEKIDSFAIRGGQTQSQFATTPRISPHLVAFVISKLEETATVEKANYTYRIFSRPSLRDYLSTAKSYGPSLVDALGDWTGFSYNELGNKQISQVILPNVDANTDEHWGLITYKEVDILDEGDKTSYRLKQKIVTTLARELAEVWFAGFVTPDWWSDVWLDKGFATYLEYYLPQVVDGLTFQGLENDFVVNVLQGLLEVDSSSSLPLSSNETDINTPNDDISKINDISSYKGAILLRTIRGDAGEEGFQKAVHSYLKKYRFNYTEPEDIFYEVMEAYSSRFTMDFDWKSWTHLPGYPLLKVDYNHNRSFVLISQEPWDTSDNTSKWYIPITYATGGSKDFSITMRDILVPGYTNRIMESISNDSWIIFNVQHHDAIHVLNRAQLIDDVFALAKTGRVSYERAFDLSDYLNFETEYYPWASAFAVFDYLLDKVADEETHALLQGTILRLWANSRESVKNKGISYRDSTSETLSNYDQRSTVFCYALRNSSDSIGDYNFLLNLYTTTTSKNERDDIIRGLGCAWDATVLSLYLNETLKANSTIRREDVIDVYRSVYTSGDVGIDAVLTFAFNNAPAIVAKYEGMRVLTSIFVGLGPKLRTNEQQKGLLKIVDYYSEIDDILICDIQVSYVMRNITLFNEKYGDTIKTLLLEKQPQDGGANSQKPCYMLFVIIVSFMKDLKNGYNKQHIYIEALTAEEELKNPPLNQRTQAYTSRII